MTYSNTFIVEIQDKSVKGNLSNHGSLGNPQSLTNILIFKTNLKKHEVLNFPGVVSVEDNSYDAPMTMVQDRPLSWFLPSASNTMPDYTYARTGENVAIYIMDSGVRFDHDEFAGRDTETVYSYDGLDYGGDAAGPDHGTMAASCAAGNQHGIAKKASIYSLRYNWSTIEGIKALDTMFAHYLSHDKPSVLSMSFGSQSNIYDSIFTTLINYGVVMVASAGNYDEPMPLFPARRPDVIAVAACDTRFYPSKWGQGQATNYGKEIDIWAGGTGGVAASIYGEKDTQWAGGTSSACPLVAGNISLLLQGQEKLKTQDDVMAIKAALLESARKDVIKYTDDKYASTPNNYIYTLGDTGQPVIDPVIEPEPEEEPVTETDKNEDGKPAKKSRKLPIIIAGLVAVVMVALFLTSI